MTTALHVIFLLGSLTTAALAVDGRVLPFATPLTGFDGKALEDPKTGPVTLSSVTVDALIVTIDADKTLPAIEKFKHDELARRIFNDPNTPLQAEEINLIKERIGAVYGPEVVYPAWKLIEGGAK
jgi:hypothetical protein